MAESNLPSEEELLELLLSRINFYIAHRWAEEDIRVKIAYDAQRNVYFTNYRVKTPSGRIAYVLQEDVECKNWITYYRITDETIASITLLLGS